MEHSTNEVSGRYRKRGEGSWIMGRGKGEAYQGKSWVLVLPVSNPWISEWEERQGPLRDLYESAKHEGSGVSRGALLHEGADEGCIRKREHSASTYRLNR